MKINLGKKDIAVIIREDGLPSLYFPEIDDNDVPDNYTYLTAMITFIDDKKFINKIIKKWIKLINKLKDK